MRTEFDIYVFITPKDFKLIWLSSLFTISIFPERVLLTNIDILF